VATADDERFGAALLYSCATDNNIYRKLAETSDVILYRGAPYNQQQYAYGINLHVGPVTGWQPPVAPNRKHVRQSHPLWKRLEQRSGSFCRDTYNYATTHCKGGNAQVHLKSTVSSVGGSALSSTTGSGATEVFRAETQAPGRLPVRVRWL
jgi:hypothetical protein